MKVSRSGLRWKGSWALLALCLFSVSCSAYANKSQNHSALAALAGLWEPVEVSHTGLSTAVDIRADGTCVLLMTVLVNQRYEIEDGHLYRLEPDGSRGKWGNPIEVEGDRMTLGRGSDAEVYERLSGSSDSWIGTWKGSFEGMAASYLRFYADGWQHLRIPMAPQRGRCRATGDRLILGSGRSAEKASYRLEGDRMTLKEDSGPTTVMRRTEAWYPTEWVVPRAPGR